jgi:hypothetical protein
MSAYDTIRNKSLEYLYQTENSLNVDTSDETWEFLSPEYLVDMTLRNRDVGTIWLDLFL